MPALFALSVIGVLCCVGMILRRWVPFLRNNLVPATVIAGFLGTIVMNAGLPRLLEGVDAELLAGITTQLFTLAFISIGLTQTPRAGGPRGARGSGLLRGSWSMGLTWTLLFSLQALLGFLVVFLAGSRFGMDPMYGLLAAFAFAQGPGQAATFGAIFEQQGWEGAVPVALAFAAVGFAASFLMGVPLAKWGMRLGLGKHSVPLSDSVRRGYYPREEQRESMGRVTTFPGNFETLGFHFALMGIAYLGAHGISWCFAFLPGFLGTTMSGLMFFNGLLAALAVRWALNRVGLGHLLDSQLQAKITGFTSDYLVVASFMAVQLAVVVDWLVPILLACAVLTLATLVICYLIGQRYGSDHDFERTMGLYGTATGTTPTGLTLVRIIDPRLKTATMAEMGLMNLPEMLYIPAMLTIAAGFAGTLAAWPVAGILAALTLAYFVLMLVTRSIGPRTFSFSRRWNGRGRGSGGEADRLEGELNQSP